METKEVVRSRLLSQRLALERAERIRFSRTIVARLKGSGLIGGVKTMGFYSPVKNEVETEMIFEEFKRGGNRAVYPRVGERGIDFVHVSDPADLVSGTWGIPEPVEGEVVSASDIDAILVPGIAFDELGYRLGFGKGLYDRALETYRGRKIGLGYEFQILKKLPTDERDIRCHWIVTEKRVIQGDVLGGRRR